MRLESTGVHARFVILLILVVAWPAIPASPPSKQKPLPSFKQVQQAVLSRFATLPDYQPHDLITRGQVEPLFGHFERLGWKVADREEILAQVPSESDFLPRQLSTPTGRKFMRQIAGYPNAYDRLDRLSQLPHGKQTIRDLVRGPGGAKMIKYMTESAGGGELGKLLSNAPRGREFNKATDRIYTVEKLLTRLEKSHQAAQKARRSERKR